MAPNPSPVVQGLLSADPIIWRADIEAACHVCSETVRRWMRSARLPPPDIHPTRKVMGWKLSTLRKAGFDLATASAVGIDVVPNGEINPAP